MHGKSRLIHHGQATKAPSKPPREGRLWVLPLKEVCGVLWEQLLYLCQTTAVLMSNNCCTSGHKYSSCRAEVPVLISPFIRDTKDDCCLNDFCWRFSFVVGATIYICSSNNKQKSYRGSKGKTFLLESKLKSHASKI